MVKFVRRQHPLKHDTSDLLQLYQKAKQIYQAGHKRQAISSSDQRWFQKLLTSGTVSDRISALTIRIKDDPNHCLESVETVIETASSLHQRTDQLKCLFNTKDIFVFLLAKLPKVATFQSCLLTTPKPTDEQLSQFFVAHNTRRLLNDFIKVVDEKQKDPLIYVRRQSTIILVELYATNNEATKYLLPMLVNKFGDSDRRLIANLTKSLTAALNRTPSLALRVLKELENFIYRPNLKADAQFYALNFVNQLNLPKLDASTIQFILKMFFTLFTKLMKVDDAVTECSKILSQILRAINRVLPVAKSLSIDTEAMHAEQQNDLYKLLRKTSNFKIRIQTLYFIYQTTTLSDRFYRVLYDLVFSYKSIDKILDPEIEQTKLQELFFDLLFLSLKQDTSLPRQKAFIKRLLQVASKASPDFATTCLVFVSKLMDQVKGLYSMVQQPESFFVDEEEERYADVDEEAPLQDKVKDENTALYYDPCKREPKFCRAESTALWELHAFLNSFHPVVREYAQTILRGQQGQVLAPKENPLHEHNLSTFLTNFISKSSRKTKRISTSVQLVEGEELNSSQMTESNRHAFKYLKRRFSDRLNKETALGKKSGGVDEEDEDRFADELFEKELRKGEGEDEDELEDIDMDDDDSMMEGGDEEDDDGDFPFGQSESDEDEPKEELKKAPIQKKIQKTPKKLPKKGKKSKKY